jgi:lysophospholipase L1-like esterase
MKSLTVILVVFGLAIQASAAPKLYLAGDSTMANKPTEPPNPEYGWGQILPKYFKDATGVVNYAQNGASTRSFITGGLWKKLVDALQPGDWAIIQFAHNDEKIFPNARGEFQTNLRRFIADVRSKGANPILATPCARRSFDASGNLVDTHGDYPEAVRIVAIEEKVPLLEMNRLTADLEQGHGEEGSKRLHLWIPAGVYQRQPQGYEDNTHYSAYGAGRVAALAVQEMIRLQLPITQGLAP